MVSCRQGCQVVALAEPASRLPEVIGQMSEMKWRLGCYLDGEYWWIVTRWPTTVAIPHHSSFHSSNQKSTAKNTNLTALFPNLFPINFHLDLVWLVVGPPLWKIWKSIGMMKFPILMGTSNWWQPNHQPVVICSDTPWAYLCRASYVLGPDWPASARPPVLGPASSPRGWCSAAWPGRRPTARRRLRRTAGPKPTTW